jgi:LuxR family quorum sensing-dependent transcriptional regulator
MPKNEMNFIERTFEYLDELEGNSLNERGVACSLGKLAAECGYEYFTITRLPQPKIRLGPAMLLSKWSKAWLSHYDGAGYYQFDPIGRRCFETTEPFVWSDVRCSAEDRMASRVMNEAAEHGLRYGLCVPMHGLYGFPAVASFAGAAPELSRKRRSALHLAALATYGWVERHEHARREATHVKLSPRERDVLIWTAIGLTNSDVGEHLGVSPLTVRTHLERARTKLGAVNAVNTVVEALRRREIRL